MQVVVQGLLTEYDRAGKGPSVLLLHGWGDSRHTYGGLAVALKTDYDVIRLDLPGFGGTKAPESVWGLKDYAYFIEAFLEKVGTSRLFAVIGHSNGGAIAIRAVGEKILKPEKLILLSAAGIRDTFSGSRKVMRLAAKLGKALTAPLPKKIQHKLKRKAYKTIGSDLFVAENLQETFKKIVTDDVKQDAKRIGTPTLLIYGNNDKTTPLSYGEKYQSLIKNSRLERLPSGHFVHKDQPEAVTKLITEFLGQ